VAVGADNARLGPPPLARRRARPLWLELAWQALLITIAFLTYFGVRGATEGSEARATANAADLAALQERLGIMWEPWLQAQIAGHQSLVDLSNWIYIWGHWPFIGVVAIWLFAWRRPSFYLLRNAIFISGAIGLVFFLTLPMAPPRLFPELSVIDTVTEHSRAYRALQPPALVNQYAAFPSLHVGFNLLVGIALFGASRRWWVRVIAIGMPAAMAAAVVLTANHYLLDVVAGCIVALVGLAAARGLGNPRLTRALGGEEPRRLPSPEWIGRLPRRSAPRS
jgi:membrane-associated phospholipid phosphatase